MARKTALITGITGFAGSHLAEHFLSLGWEVHGTRRWRSRMENVAAAAERMRLFECDLSDFASVRSTVSESKPDAIFHLAAQSFVPTSWRAPAETLSVNIIGTANLLEAVRVAGLNPTIQIAGSSEEYGIVTPEETPIKEDNPLRPASPYGVSKVAADLLGYQYHRSYGMRIIRTRAFNHTGPRRGDVFVTSNFAKQVAEIEAGVKKPPIMVGNLDAQRDFTDVRDVVVAYRLAVEKGEPGEVYNICSGVAVPVRKVLDTLLSFSKKKIPVETDPARLRPSDVPLLLGDCTKFRERTGWKPKIPFEKTMEDLLEYWRDRVAKGRH